jgi:hypothetical protein
VPIVASQARHLWETLSTAYRVLGLDRPCDDEVFQQLTLARVIEPTSKLDSIRVLTEVGITAPSYPTIKRRLPVYATGQRLAAAGVNRGRRPESKESLTRWLARVGPDVLLGGLSPSARVTYRSYLARRIIPELGHLALSAITAAHIEAAQRSWKSSNVSPTVIAGTLNCLARLSRVAIKQGGDLSLELAYEGAVARVGRPTWLAGAAVS